MALFVLRKYIHDHRLYLTISTASTTNEEQTIHCRKIKFRGYATDASRNRHAAAIWAIVLIDQSNKKYTYIMEEAKTASNQQYTSIKQALIGKELSALCYSNTNVIKQIRNVKL